MKVKENNFLEDWHTHNKLCHHAEGIIEDYVKEAIRKGLRTIGISDHFPYEFYTGLDGIPYDEYGMILSETRDYLSTIQELKAKYKEQINIKCAFEIDFIPHQVVKLNQQLEKIKDHLDYILGSIHMLFAPKEPWSFDDSRFLDEFNRYESVDDVYFHYYDSIILMITSSDFDFDIVSHLDLPKKFNKFPEHKELVMEKVVEVLEYIKKQNLVVEINTGGFRKEVHEQYPSIEIIKKIFELEIPIVLSSDAHKPSEIAYKFDYMLNILTEIGFTELAHFTQRKRSIITINR
ncbi:MAG: Histidinol-phosphatase [Promethearchaeota archaeon]|nr:MAG: Histidinol-phosphatase [Candidatus Lokiarchaeota archaeon]